MKKLLFTFAFCLFAFDLSYSATRLGLHVTAEELAIWKTRAASGPYKTAGDAGFSNTPGDWDRIVTNMKSFMSNPSTEIYTGYTGAGCVPRFANIEPLTLGFNIRDAAFYSLVQNDAAVRAQVLSTLLTQIAQTGTNFANTAKWCVQPVADSTLLLNGNPAFAIAEWATRILYAYDFIRSTVGTTNQKNIDAWFLAAGTYMRHADVNIVKDLYCNSVVSSSYCSTDTQWLAGTLSSGGTAAFNDCTVATWGRTYDGGPAICLLGMRFSNRNAQMTSFYGHVGIMLNDTTMKAWAKNWFQEWLKYGVYPDTSNTEMNRTFSDGVGPDQGWQYGNAIFGKMLDLADAFGRIGDLSLFNYSTTAGTVPSAGTPAKTIRLAAEFYRATTEGNLVVYGYQMAHDTTHLIDGVLIPGDNSGLDGYYPYDVQLAEGNLFWQDSSITTAYRNPGAANKLGHNTALNTARGYMGSGSAYPGLLFMFGQMEGVVNPYVLTPGLILTITTPTANPTYTSTAQTINLGGTLQ